MNVLVVDAFVDMRRIVRKLRQVRADEKLKAARFIMAAAESKTGNVLAAKMAGVDGFVVKPFNGLTLQQKINSVVAAPK